MRTSVSASRYCGRACSFSQTDNGTHKIRSDITSILRVGSSLHEAEKHAEIVFSNVINKNVQLMEI